jgi:hypothetical protein
VSFQNGKDKSSFRQKVQEVIGLARYAYSDSLSPDLETEIDGLRKLICFCIAANVEIVLEHNSFMGLIEDDALLCRILEVCENSSWLVISSDFLLVNSCATVACKFCPLPSLDHHSAYEAQFGYI